MNFLGPCRGFDLWRETGPTADVVGRCLSRLRRSCAFILWTCFLLCAAHLTARAAVIDPPPDLSRWEGRPVSAVEVVLEGVPRDAAAEAELRSLLTVAPTINFSAVQVRESLQALFGSGRVANARVEAIEAGGGAGGPVRLLFVVDKGFFQAEVPYTQTVNPAGTSATITYRITPGPQARVDTFNIKVAGFDDARVRPELELKPGAPFTRAALGEDLNRIRQAIIAGDNLAPQLNDAQVTRDPQSGRITINLTGNKGPQINVNVTGYEIGEDKARELLPVKREGTIDLSAIVEGERRLENELQEEGYFFADVTPLCSITPAGAAAATTDAATGTREACETISPQEVGDRTVNITYEVEPGRRLRLTDVRIEGTELFTYDDLAGELRTRKSNALALVPFLDFGRGYTSD
ncbi:MAG: hypothetical protein LC742_01595, partial [Acidobacteria bacterium]|nr:hypothetical protein [Acidobacteriota bacterium]